MYPSYPRRGHSGHSGAHIGDSGAHTRAIKPLWGTRGGHTRALAGIRVPLEPYEGPRSYIYPSSPRRGHSGLSGAHVCDSGAHTRAIELLWGTRWGHTRALAGIRVPLEPYECPRSYMYVCFPRTLLARGHSGHSGAAHIGCVKAPWYYGETPNRGGGEFGSCFVTPPKCPPLVVV